jgi:hypothetical protein
MTRIRAALLLFVIVVAAATILPVTREEFSWLWADSHDSAADFMKYLEDWPQGRHAAEAHQKYDQRRWMDTKKSLISQAYQQAAHSSPEADAEYRKEKRLRRDSFFWKQAVAANTAEAYRDYLQQFPKGQHERQASNQIAALLRNTNMPPPQLPP